MLRKSTPSIIAQFLTWRADQIDVSSCYLRKGFQVVNFAEVDGVGSVWILSLRKISASRDGREKY